MVLIAHLRGIRRSVLQAIGALAALQLAPASAVAAPDPAKAAASVIDPAARPAAAVVDAFHRALERGDASQALTYLADDALIFEAGGVERGKKEYAAHHLAADSAFSKAVPSKITRRVGHVAGPTAWIATEGRTTGEFKGKPVNRKTVETMVLRRSGGAWKIVHIHWSSAAAGSR